MTNEEMLIKLREERDGYIINEVLSFELNDMGFYDVMVDMEGMFYETRILHNRVKLPYPNSEFEKLTRKEQLDWMWTGLDLGRNKIK